MSINHPIHRHAELLRAATQGVKRIERDAIEPSKVFKPRHKKESKLNIRDLLGGK